MKHMVSGVGVLDKSMAVLDVVAASDAPVALRELVTRTGFSKATTHRLAAALESHGLLRRSPEGQYQLGDRLVGLGELARSGWQVAEVARPALASLREATGESVQLYRRDGEQRVCAVSLDSAHELRTMVPQGSRHPLGIGSSGRILAGDGSDAPWVQSIGERAPGVASVSAPIRVGGALVAAVGISGPVERLGAHPGDRHGPAVVQAAQSIEGLLRDHPDERVSAGGPDGPRLTD